MTAMDQDAVPLDGDNPAARFGVVAKRRGAHDERIASANWLTRLLRRPEAGAAGGLIAALIIFAFLPGATALYSLQGSMTFLTLSAELGIIATAAALLIIAGEFDLSVGSMIGFAGVVIGLTVRELGFPLWGGVALGLRGGDRRRLVQRADRGQDPAAVLHRHARLALHPPRPVDRHHPERHRPDPDPLHPRGRSRSVDRHDLQRPHPRRLLPVDGRAGLDRDAERRHPLRPRHPDVDRLVHRRRHRRRLDPDQDPLRQLDLRLRRRRDGRAQRRRAGRPGEDHPVHRHRLRGDAARLHPGDGGRLRRHAPRHAQGIRGDHRRGDRRRAAHRRLRHGDRRHPRRADLRLRADGHLLHRHRHRLVQGLPRRDDPDRGAGQQLHPRQGARREDARDEHAFRPSSSAASPSISAR